MAKYTFCINGNYRMVEATSEQEAIQKAGIRKRDTYSLVETESVGDTSHGTGVVENMFSESRKSIQ
ncbi:MAG TPA: hypothetical protein VHO84_01245 [Syntrophorhabdaceae bacterium]|nr:hypothetical protein [Syntrophorhabdaceae bacterium]